MLDPSMQAPANARREPWQLGWEHVQCLVDGISRPLAWSSANLILTAHAILPKIYAQLIPPSPTPSVAKFTIPSPPPIINAPAKSYAPPTVISLSPSDAYLFAYFPPDSGAEGIACVWERGAEISTWAVKEYWSVPRVEGILCCKWLGEDRQWVVASDSDASDIPRFSRRPYAGPPTLSTPTFLLITHSCYASLYYHPPLGPSSASFFSVLRANLTTPLTSNQATQLSNAHDSAGGLRLCLRAEIGIQPEIAIQSILVPPIPNLSNPSMAFTSPGSPPDYEWQWEQWGERQYIELCEIRLDLFSSQPTMTVSPLLPIPTTYLASRSPGTQGPPPPATPWHLSHLRFVSAPLPTPKESSDFKGKGLVSYLDVDEEPERLGFHLLAGCMDLGNYVSPLKTHIYLWSITRPSKKLRDDDDDRPVSVISVNTDDDSTSGKKDASDDWLIKMEAQRTFNDSALGFVEDVPPSTGEGVVLAGLLNLMGRREGVGAGSKVKVGRVVVLNLQDLSDNAQFRSSDLIGCGGRDPPVSMAMSPNHTLICTTTSVFSPLDLAIVPFPRRISPTAPSSHAQSSAIAHSFSTPLALSVVRGTDPSDVIRAFWSNSTAAEALIGETWKTLSECADSGEVHPSRASEPWMSEMMKIAVAVFKSAPDPKLGVRWQTAFDVCQLEACEQAFDDCDVASTSPDTDQETRWKLIHLSQWFVELCQSIVKEAILYEAHLACEWQEGGGDEGPREIDSASEGPNSSLLFLLHPWLLSLLRQTLSHVHRLRSTLMTASPDGAARVAKNVLADIFDASSIDMEELRDALIHVNNKNTSTVASIPDATSQFRTALLTFSVPSRFFPLLAEHARYLSAYTNLVDKMRLLINPSELLDLPPPFSADWDRQPRDVIGNATLRNQATLRTCTRCGSKSSRARKDAIIKGGERWRAFETSWERSCVCGGLWMANLD
ncbi:hypothetical protein BOTBODRAFT_169828 [Botryobasidium botryosum FD-172 SS1]|uniref:Mediator complex subunit 16 C-terminal domain-containing protein n=1 Tax=Botryobasidium botryosum (strain FD-172 SS1) TaxID=930990 RepID=A0A067N7M4_BOTB1|nr:hypothetical protein BOTBODRAFT_169828 [Botryobasidium botryosum FD-172 SS1]